MLVWENVLVRRMVLGNLVVVVCRVVRLVLLLVVLWILMMSVVFLVVSLDLWKVVRMVCGFLCFE